MRVLWLLNILACLNANNDFCVPLKFDLNKPSPSIVPGPLAIGNALQQYHRRCLYVYLPKPQTTTILELCLFKSSRIIDENNFSIFLGYFENWSDKDGFYVHTYSGGQTWSCTDKKARSMSLQVLCGKNKIPEIIVWKDNGDCSYTAVLVLFCA